MAGLVSLLGAATTGTRAENLNRAGTVTAVAGPVMVSRLSANPQPLKFRDTLFWRDVVEARKDGIARALLLGKTTVTVREFTRLELREERRADGVGYVAELISGKVRASVARMLMRPGDQVEVRTRNAVASVRGTDFIVETVERPSPAGAFGLLGALEVSQGLADRGARTGETVVVTLSGTVEVSNRLTGAGRVEQVGAYQAGRVSGIQDPARIQLGANDLKVLLAGLTPPRPHEARSEDKTEAARNEVERVVLSASAPSERVLAPAGGDGRSAEPLPAAPATASA
ncbi:MAG: FecR domain-containing protein, partial [Candidatus Rokubacteria bacterium]|nr:FecR domain-containing protein [Candidatus Rokubacteria bacterium]